ncbi:hypothetical protein RFI_37047, partial [Reticulomyxa filosa]
MHINYTNDPLYNVISLIRELTEGDNYDNETKDKDKDKDKEQNTIALAEVLIQQNGVGLLLDNLDRLRDTNMLLDPAKEKKKAAKNQSKNGNNDDDDDDDGGGHDDGNGDNNDNNNNNNEENDDETIYSIFAIIENLSEIDPDYCVAMAKSTNLLKILLNWMRKRQVSAKKFDEIQHYCY